MKIRSQKTFSMFTPLESPSIYAGDGRNRKHQLLIKGGVKALAFLTGFILIVLFFSFTFADEALSKTIKKSPQTKPTQATPSKKKVEPAKEVPSRQATQGGLQCDAQSAVLMDGLTGEILYEQSPDQRIPPASFVKVLTLYLIFDAIRAGQLKMEDMVTVSEKAWKTQGSKMFIKVGERVKVEDLVKGIAITSGNDACIALAEHLAGSEEVFASKMNERAKVLGMKNSQFKNSHGMPSDDQYMTAMDMALLAKRYIEDHPETLAIHSTTEFEYNGIKQGNRNILLQKNIGVDGLKTGHIEESGYHLVATAKRDGQRMIAVVMGCDKMKKRAPETRKLLEYGFKNFSTVEAVKKGASFGPLKVKRGKLDQVSLTASEDGRVTVPKGKENLVSAIPQLPAFVSAPIQKGQVLAKVLVQKEGKTVKEVNLFAQSDVLKSLIPPWPILVGSILGLVLLCVIGLWFFRRPPRRRL
ncbi:MAG: D-alanyl-D-alanine carboxypeptidase family protein [Deltaproteobacteria bacterium]|nr:D-alanyl-D-alanine carboxypeptidase family protein [Deltaproteobacteria bacterium]